jgi:ABC-type polysaccharide/polyol phosphate export permease
VIAGEVRSADQAVPSYTRGFVLKGERTPLRRLVADVWRSAELIRTLSRKDFFVRYRRASFGVVWSVVVPLLQAVVMSVILTRFIRFNEVSPFPVYVFAGTVAWTFFTSAVTAATTSIVDGADLSTKIYFPRAVFPLVSVGTQFYTLVPSAAVLLTASLAFGVAPGPHLLLLLAGLALLMALALSFALVLSALYVYFRDTRYAVQASLIAWFYATPIFYPIGRTGFAEPYIQANPVTGVVELLHAATVDTGSGPLAVPVAWTVGWTLALLGCGLFLHRRFDRLFSDLL